MAWTNERRREWEREWSKRPEPAAKKKARQAEYYRNNKERFAEHRRAARKKKQEWLTSLKKDKPCVDCGGVFHPVVMQWHHVNGDKKFCISQSRASNEKILAEVEKCVLLCANCHAVRTWG